MLLFGCMNIEEIKPKIAELAKKYGLSLVLLFGSQATGKTHPRSDVDIAFLAKKRLDLIDVARLQMVFSETLRIKDLELVDIRNAGPLLLKQIAGKSALLYQKDPFSFYNFKIYALKIFMESKRLFDLQKLSFSRFLQKI